jgi:hypothetical protein
MSRRFHRGRSIETQGWESRRTLVAAQPFVSTPIFRWVELRGLERAHLRTQPDDFLNLSAFVIEMQVPAAWRGLGHRNALGAILRAASISHRHSVMPFATCCGNAPMHWRGSPRRRGTQHRREAITIRP